MCVAAIAWRAHPDWALVAIGNRDEFHDRPAEALSKWPGAKGVIAGRDKVSQGTWLGVTEAGRFALVTNRRGFGQPDPSLQSRGRLVTDMLVEEGRYRDPSLSELGDFNPFNLIVATRDEARFLANHPEHTDAQLPQGIYGLSNGALDAPWPKTLFLKAELLRWLNEGKSGSDALFSALGRDTLPDPGLHPSEPSDISVEASDTAPFIRNRIYGTRCSTVVTIDASGDGNIAERRFGPDGKETGRSELPFRWSA